MGLITDLLTGGVRRDTSFEKLRPKFAKHPDPEVSSEWSDGIWPPSDWYDMPAKAYGKTDVLWQFDSLKTYRHAPKKITEEQMLLWAVENMVGQVCNGGFSQAFYNSYGELAEEAIIGLRRFGFLRHVDIFERAFDAFGLRPVPRSRVSRIAQLERLSAYEEAMEEPSDFLEHYGAVAKGTSDLWEELETDFFALLSADGYGEGYNAAYYRPLAEWIRENRERFFIV